MQKLSLVITLYDEEANIAPLLTAIDLALYNYHYEIILVDDGSTDSTVQAVKNFADERVKLIVFRRNYGQTAAMAAGIEAASGDYIVTLDGDLQNDPADIPMMLMKLIDEDWDIVAGFRKDRQDAFLGRKLPSRMANWIIGKLTGVGIRDYGCTLKVFKKNIAKSLDLYGELHRFIPILAVLQGAKITDVEVHHHPRRFGTSKYGIGRTFNVISDLLLLIFFQKYFKRPIHFFGPIGIICFLAGCAVNFYLLFLKILGNDIWGRPLLILGITLLLAGIQFLTFGIIIEMIMRVYHESQHKKTYTIKEIYHSNKNIQPEVESSIA